MHKTGQKPLVLILHAVEKSVTYATFGVRTFVVL